MLFVLSALNSIFGQLLLLYLTILCGVAMAEDKNAVTVLLQKAHSGDEQSLKELIPLVYDELNSLAQKHLYSERAGHTINPTALAHEAYLKLTHNQIQPQNRQHFFALAAQSMRRILIDYARARNSQKRAHEKEGITIVRENVAEEIPCDDILALNEAMESLKKLSERQANVVEYWFFGGLTHEEIAEVLVVSLPTVRRDWRLARAYLSQELNQME